MDPATISLIATAAASLLGGLTGGNKVPPEQRDLMRSQRGLVDIEAALQKLMLQRKQAQDPLWRALQSMAFNRLPSFAKSGFDISAMQNPVGVRPPLQGLRERDFTRPVGTEIVDSTAPRPF